VNASGKKDDDAGKAAEALRAEHHGSRDLVVVSGRNVTEWKNTEAALRASENVARSLVKVRADVSAALSEPVPAREMLRGCAEAIVRHLEAPFARIWTLNNQGNMLELQASAGIYTRLDGTYGRIRVGNLKVGLIAQEKKPHLTNDVLNDPRVADKEWARSCGFVSFAGYPLLVEGRAVGVMAMFARHALSDATLDTLASVADAIAQGIERKRAEDELRRSETYLAEAQRMSHTGSFRWRISTGGIIWSAETYRIFQYARATKPTVEFVLRRVHSEDAELVKQTLDGASQDRKDFDLEHRLLMPDGSVKYLHVVAHALTDESGGAEFVGSVMEVTEQHRARAALETALDEIKKLKDQLPISRQASRSPKGLRLRRSE